MRYLWVNNDNTIEVNSLRNTLTNVTDNSASVELTIADLEGTPVSGQTWPLILQNIAPGRYVTTVGVSVVIEEEQDYLAVIVVTGSAGEYANWRLTCRAKRRDQ